MERSSLSAISAANAPSGRGPHTSCCTQPERFKHAGAVSLVGDALHLMDISIGMGAVSALEGGLEVAQCLAAEFFRVPCATGAEAKEARSVAETAEAALRRYEVARLERSTAVQQQAFTQSSKWGEHHRRQWEKKNEDGTEEAATSAGTAAAATVKSDRPTPAAGKFAQSGASAMQISPEFVDWLHGYVSPWTEHKQQEMQQFAPHDDAEEQ